MRSWSFRTGSCGRDRPIRASRPSPSRLPARAGAVAASLVCEAARTQGLRQERSASQARGKSRAPGPDLSNPVRRPCPAALLLTPPPPLSPSLDHLARSNIRRAEHEDERSKTATLRDLHPQIDRAQSRSCLQLTLCPEGSLRGLYQEPSPRGLDAHPREIW